MSDQQEQESSREEQLLRINAYIDNELSVAERAAFEAEMAQDASLRAEVAALQRVDASILQLPELEVPRNFILDPNEFDAFAAAPLPDPTPSAAPWWQGLLRMGGILGLLIVLVGGSVLLGTGLFGSLEPQVVEVTVETIREVEVEVEKIVEVEKEVVVEVEGETIVEQVEVTVIVEVEAEQEVVAQVEPTMVAEPTSSPPTSSPDADALAGEQLQNTNELSGEVIVSLDPDRCATYCWHGVRLGADSAAARELLLSDPAVTEVGNVEAGTLRWQMALPYELQSVILDGTLMIEDSAVTAIKAPLLQPFTLDAMIRELGSPDFVAFDFVGLEDGTPPRYVLAYTDRNIEFFVTPLINGDLRLDRQSLVIGVGYDSADIAESYVCNPTAYPWEGIGGEALYPIQQATADGFTPERVLPDECAP